MSNVFYIAQPKDKAASSDEETAGFRSLLDAIGLPNFDSPEGAEEAALPEYKGKLTYTKITVEVLA